MILKFLLLAAVLLFLSHEVVAKTRKHVVCYHGTWATYRQSNGKFDISNIDPFLCTHLMYAFFGIEENGNLRIIDPYLDLDENYGRDNIRKFNALKLQNPILKTLAAIGGWNEGSKNFSIVAADAEKRARFVRSTVQFLQKYGFDGIDLDWEYPNQRHSLPNDDRTNYVHLIRELKEGLDPFGYMLTAAVGSAEYSAAVSYNIPEIVKYLDIINVMAYDLHGSWDNVTGLNAPLFNGNNDVTTKTKQLNVQAIVSYWIEQGAPKDKLVIGVPFYGRSFTLEDADQNTPGSPHLGRGVAGQYSLEPGVIGYNELCEKFKNEAWTKKWEPSQMAPYAYNERQWVGYENLRSIDLKTKYIRDNDLAGVMIWSIESDDFHGICSNVKYPLLKQINHILFNTKTPAVTVTVPINNADFTDENLDSTLKFKCQNEKGYVRDPHDCAKFYFCDAGITHNFECPLSLSFDINTLSCNYSSLVKCFDN